MPTVTPSRATTVPTILAVPQPDGSVRCGVCAHRCLVRPGRQGICGVRENRDGQLVSLAYGAVVAIGLDPIEKKPLFHVAPGTTAYSIATAGCPFHCTFCQNWEIAQGPRLGLDLAARPLPPDRVVSEAVSHGAGSVAYTYVEPTVFLEYALDTARLAREAGLRNLFITDGYATPEAVGLLAPVLDAANVDLKSFDDAFYRKVCGARLAPVLESIVAMRQAGIWLELTTLIIPGRNDDEAELRALTSWIVETLGPETPWHVTRFMPHLEFAHLPATPIPTLEKAVRLGHDAGLRFVYLGNVPGHEGENTVCPNCRRLLVRRTGYAVEDVALRGTFCAMCGENVNVRTTIK